MEIFGYIFTIINYVLYCSSRFCKEKKNMLVLDILAKICTILSFVFLNSMTGAVVMFISIILLLIARYKETNSIKTNISIFLFSIFVIFYIVNMVITFNGIPSVLITITALITLFSIWWLSPQNMRKVGAFNSVLYLCYQISIKNWAGLLEILVILSNLISFIKYNKK